MALARINLIFSLLFALFFISCNRGKDPGVVTYTLGRSDYIEKISVPGTVEAVVNVPVMAPSRMMGQMTVVKLASDGAFVKTGDTICVLSVPELETMYRQTLSVIEILEAGLKKTLADNQLSLALLEAQLATAEAQLKISSLDSLRMQYAPEVTKKLLTLEMKKTLIEKEKIEKKVAFRKAIGQTEIRQANARIMSEKARAQTYADQVKSLVIIASREGIVTRTESPEFYIMGPQGLGKLGGPITEGSVLFANTPVLMFPDLSKMQVAAEVQEADYKKTEKGQKVKITLDAARMLETSGRINRKTLKPGRTNRYSPTKVKLYEVIIDVDSCHSIMKPGLSALCEITLQEIRDTLFVPTLAIFERDSAKVVYVLENNRFFPVEIGTGLSGSSHTVVTSGLRGDEIIALSEPPYRLMGRKPAGREPAKAIEQGNK